MCIFQQMFCGKIRWDESLIILALIVWYLEYHDGGKNSEYKLQTWVQILVQIVQLFPYYFFKENFVCGSHLHISKMPKTRKLHTENSRQ
jgi:hypothetical protein